MSQLGTDLNQNPFSGVSIDQLLVVLEAFTYSPRVLDILMLLNRNKFQKAENFRIDS